MIFENAIIYKKLKAEYTIDPYMMLLAIHQPSNNSTSFIDLANASLMVPYYGADAIL
jgi:hypothetical protein